MKVCPECNNTIEQAASVCPKCGFPFETTKKAPTSTKKVKTIPVKVRTKKTEETPKTEEVPETENTGFVLIDEEEYYEDKNNKKDYVADVELIPQTLCPHCGAKVSSENTFCPTCGRPLDEKTNCAKCGQELTPGMQFCPNCGTPTKKDASSFKNTVRNVGNLDSSTLKKYLPIILAAIVAIGLFIYFAGGQSSNKLEKAYEDAGGYALAPYVTLSDDEKSLTVDTNPSDIDDFFSSEANQAIKDINKSLGLPDALWEKLLRTRALDGTQTATYDDVNLSWTYHPDNGLEVLYELTK